MLSYPCPSSLLPRLLVVITAERTVLTWLLVFFRIPLDMLDQTEHDIIERVVTEATFGKRKDDFELLGYCRATSSGMSS